MRRFAAISFLGALLGGLLEAPVCGWGVSRGDGAEWHVATTGDDAWSGAAAAPNADRTDGPFATLERARDEIRLRRKAGLAEPVTVFIHGGDYPLAKTFTLSKEDSGTPAAPVVWRAFRDERPVLIGGREITGWQPVADDTRTGGRLMRADLAAQGLGAAKFSQLVCAGRRQPLARWPNFDPANPYGGGWAYADGKLVPMYADIPGEDKRTLVMKPDDIRTWARPTDGEVFVFPRYNWWNNIVRIAAFDPATRTATLAADCSYPIRPGDRYYVQGVREELDAPGEWYHDRDAKTLLFLPPEPLDGRRVSVPTLGTIVSLGPETAHVTIRGLTFECCEGTAVSLSNTRHCTVAGCTVRHVGGYGGSGIGVSGSDNTIIGCDISHTGSNGLAISGGDRKTLAPARNAAVNNYIHHTGVFYKQGVGVALSGVGNRAAHNLIHDCPRMGIMFSGNDLVIEYNRIRHVNLETEDTGAVYTGGRDWISSRGTVIRHNFFHDILGYGREGEKWVSPHFAWGVYLDDNAGGVDVIGNIVARCSRAGLHLHNARDNRIVNNIFVDCGPQQIEYSGWTADHRFWKSHFETMVKGYESVAGEPAWADKRNMRTHPKDAVLPDGLIMTGNEFLRNVIDYRDPKASLFKFRNLPLDHYTSDDNVVWHHGLPLLVGPQEGRLKLQVDRTIAAVPVVNAGFEQEGKPGGFPAGWKWQVAPVGAKARRTEGDAVSGKHALGINAGTGKDAQGKEVPAQVVSSVVVVPGRDYRLAGRMRANKAALKVGLMLQSYVPNKFFWSSSPNTATIGTEWSPVEFVFRVPGPGEPGHREELAGAVIRIDVHGADAGVLVDDVVLEEVEIPDAWSSWRRLGFDTRSVVADPLFVDRDHDDFRLEPGSPAMKLGFEPIPVEKIGPYADELRASWPIVEAEGAREKPLAAE